MGKFHLHKKLLSLFSLLILITGYTLNAQDSTFVITQSILNDTADINIGRMDEWIFKKGHQSNWASGNLTTTDWQKKKPIELSVNDADQNGRVEGWFRLKIKTDALAGKNPIGFKYNGWGAAEIYVDGEKIESYGSAGTDLGSFQEYNPVHRLAIPLSLTPEKEHLLAIHFVDYVNSFPLPKKIKSFIFMSTGPYTFSGSLFSLTGSKYNTAIEKKVYQHMIFKISLFAIILIITTLFWLVSYQNPGEINLRLISIFSSLGVLMALERIVWHSQTAGFGTFLLLQSTQPLLANIATGLLPMVITESLQQPMKPYLKRLIVLSVITGTFSCIYFNNTLAFTVPFIVFNLLSFAISGQIIFRSWKMIKGAQWSIVIGFCAGTLSGFIVGLIRPRLSFPVYILMDGITYLSIPCAYVVYISMRFREIIHEVKSNATQLVLVSEEKKELAARQNEMLEHQVTERTAELHQSLKNLKETQKQLIQSEKMASLGELTAGIAHEIQNPLNFVNNFSEVSTELVDEMNEELDKGNTEDAKEIAADLKANLEKINHHGKRAGDIVKGMLQHSRSSSGTKEPTDVNALADEYMRLSYHGLRAKDKLFNATLKTDFDKSIGTINIIPQDIGRVILNLITNAFYAVDEKKKQTSSEYESTVSIYTKKNNGKVEISVKDNGNGIPQKVLNKIFQPFFTTKPTGQGTGLGLSLSYDIVTAHGGELKVQTKEKEGTEFIIILPMV
jgi:signal transduction histidine kinase